MENEVLWKRCIERAENTLVAEAQDLSLEPDSATIRYMTEHDIDKFIDALAQEHKCDRSAIVYYFEPIFEDDVLDYEHLHMVFMLEAVVDYELTRRIIHTAKIIVPQEVVQLAKSQK